MWRCLTMTVVLLLVPISVRAQEAAKAPEARPPEAFLAENSVFYFRFDGLESHLKAYEATALAKVFEGDAGVFLNHLVKLIQDSIGSNTVKDRLLQGLPPEQLVKLQMVANKIPALKSYLGKNGLVAGVEVFGFLPPRVQATLVFPHGGAAPHHDALVAGLELAAMMNDLQIEKTQLDGRTFKCIKTAGDFVKIFWWTEGDHLILTIGTEKPSHTLELLSAEKPKPNITANPHFQRIKGFDKYETIARGFIDAERLVKLGRAVALVTNPLGPVKNPYIDGTGLANLKSVDLLFGFAGKLERSTLVLNLAGERQGVFKVLSHGGKVALEDLPPVPPDAAGVTVLHIDPSTVYDVFRDLAIKLNPKEKEAVEDGFRKIDLTLGIDFRQELLSQLDSTVLVYNSPGEAIFGLAPGVAFKVKDPAKFKETLDTAAKSLLTVVDQDVRIEKRIYQGVEMHTFRQEPRNFPFAFTFALHKDWLVFGPYPHTVQGFVLRSNNKFTSWKPSPEVTSVLADIQKDPKAKIITLSETDPRMALKQLSSFSPFLLAITENLGGAQFDPLLVPNFQAVTEPLFPNVTAFVDRGDALQLDSYASLAIPFDPIGLETYWFGVFVLGNLF